jgi:hypothetical protein
MSEYSATEIRMSFINTRKRSSLYSFDKEVGNWTWQKRGQIFSDLITRNHTRLSQQYPVEQDVQVLEN